MSNIEELMPDIRAVARTVAFKWPSVVTVDDMVSNLTVRLMQTQGSIDKLLDLETPQRRKTLTRVGHQIASKERDDYDVFAGRYLYSVDDVKRLLAAGAIDGPDDKFRTTGIDVLDAMIELEKKNPNHTKAILDRYVDGVQHTPGSAQQKMLVRALESLTLLMNRVKRSKTSDYNRDGRRNNRQEVNRVDLDYTGEPRYDD
jgi:hypothetical protein